MKTTINIRPTLWTEFGPAGHRLARERPLPCERFDFDTQEEAEIAREKLQAYCDRWHDKPEDRRKKS